MGLLSPQTQSSVAVGDDAGNWFLVNASPDLPFQLRSNPHLAPNSDSPRNSPIAALFLTSADVDHVAGALSLREGNPLHIYTTAAIENSASILGVTKVLQSFCGIQWHHPQGACFPPLRGNDGRESSMSVRALPLSGRAPRYALSDSHEAENTIALQFLDRRTNKRLLVAPGIAAWTDALQEAAAESDALLVDGTFWSEDELCRVRPGAATASEMGHLPIHTGTLPILGKLPCRYRVYLHINNTNPIFASASPERAAIQSAGVIVGRDGMNFDL